MPPSAGDEAGNSAPARSSGPALAARLSHTRLGESAVETRGSGVSVAGIILWDDNPSEMDFLGFDAVVVPVMDAIQAPELDPVTIGIHAPWGGGKSTVLGLIAQQINGDRRYLVVRTDPWEYDDQTDVKGTVIAEVLGALAERFGADAGLKDRTKALLKRISWSRVGIAIANGALTMQWDAEKLIEAFTPRTKETPDSMTGFRSEFASLLEGLEIDRVVVLVDDLDRCLPGAVTATLEAIKLFLSVKKMVFVIAADQDMVRDAIAVSVDSASRGDRFATRYLEKIIQLPVSLPRLAPHEAEGYTALLLARSESPDGEAFETLLAHCKRRRIDQRFPLIGDLDALDWKPEPALLLLAAQLAQGLGSDKVSNPREIKRFLNAFSVRRHIAEARGITIEPAVIGKLLLLEDRYRDDFDMLAATPETERSALLEAWETWAARAGDDDKQPEGISKATRAWAVAEPTLSGVELGPYITLAATLVAASLGGDLSDELAALVSRLIGESGADRANAQEALAKRPVADHRQAVAGLLNRARRVAEAAEIVEALIGVAKATPELADEIAVGVRQECWRKLEPASVAALASSDLPPLAALVPLLAADPDVEADVRQAATQILAP
jgi:hypothetical protein